MLSLIDYYWPPNNPTALAKYAVKETGNRDGFNVTIEVPGYPPEGIQVTIHNGLLSVVAENGHKSLRRSFTVGNTIDVDRVEANVSLGMLTINLPLKGEAQPRAIPVVSADMPPPS